MTAFSSPEATTLGNSSRTIGVVLLGDQNGVGHRHSRVPSFPDGIHRRGKAFDSQCLPGYGSGNQTVGRDSRLLSVSSHQSFYTEGYLLVISWVHCWSYNSPGMAHWRNSPGSRVVSTWDEDLPSPGKLEIGHNPPRVDVEARRKRRASRISSWPRSIDDTGVRPRWLTPTRFFLCLIPQNPRAMTRGKGAFLRDRASLLLSFFGHDGDEGTWSQFAGKSLDFASRELDGAARQRKERVVFGSLDVWAGMKLGAALTNDDITDFGSLATKNFYSKTLGDRIATETSRTAGFSGCHNRDFRLC